MTTKTVSNNEVADENRGSITELSMDELQAVAGGWGAVAAGIVNVVKVGNDFKVLQNMYDKMFGQPTMPA